MTYGASRPPAGTLLIPLLLALLVWTNQVAARPAKGERAVVVESVTAERRPVALALERPGTLVHRRRLRVHNQEAGRIERLPFYEGDRVRRGDLLLAMDDRLLRSELRKAQADLELKHHRLKRLEKLQGQNAASADEVAEARTEEAVAQAEVERLRTRLSYTQVRAPFDGLITERLAEPGDAVPAHRHLLTLADPDSLVIRFRVTAEVLAELTAGHPLEIFLDDRAWPARILRTFPTLDPVSRLGQVEARFDERPPKARAGQLVRVRLRTPARPRLLIPLRALRLDRQGEYVYSIRDGRAHRQAVRAGRTFGDQVEILEGLEPGQILVSRGFLGLENGAKVTISSPAPVISAPPR